MTKPLAYLRDYGVRLGKAAANVVVSTTKFVRPPAVVIAKNATAMNQAIPKQLKLAPVAAAGIAALVFLILPSLNPVFANAPVAVQAQQAQYFNVSSEGSSDSQGAIVRDSFTVIPPPPKTSIATYAFLAETFTNVPGVPVQWPFLVGVPITTYYGPREAPCGACSVYHRGLDIAPGEGSQIQAMADGVVIAARNTDKNDLNNAAESYGTYVIIQHNINGQVVQSLYAHMQYNSSPLAVGDTVKVGDLVGLVGNTGQSTGPHVHFEIRVDGSTVDPMVWLPEYNK